MVLWFVISEIVAFHQIISIVLFSFLFGTFAINTLLALILVSVRIYIHYIYSFTVCI